MVNESIRPDPDPTLLTTQNMLREIGMLEKLFETRLNGIEEHIARLSKLLEEVPALIERSFLQLKELHDEKFDGVSTQLRERDTRQEQKDKDTKVAVDVGFQAAEKAVNEKNKSNDEKITKSEAGFTDQIRQLQLLNKTLGDALTDKIEDIKTLTTRLENRLITIESKSTAGADQTTRLTAMSGVLLAFFAILVGIFLHFAGTGSPPAVSPASIAVTPINPSAIQK